MLSFCHIFDVKVGLFGIGNHGLSPSIFWRHFLCMIVLSTCVIHWNK